MFRISVAGAEFYTSLYQQTLLFWLNIFLLFLFKLDMRTNLVLYRKRFPKWLSGKKKKNLSAKVGDTGDAGLSIG